MQPEYAKAGQILAGLSAKAKFVKVDVTSNNALQTEYAIASYPTLKLFVNGMLVEDSVVRSFSHATSGVSEEGYEGERKAAQLVSYLAKKASVPSIPISTVAELQLVQEVRWAQLVIFDQAEKYGGCSFFLFVSIIFLGC